MSSYYFWGTYYLGHKQEEKIWICVNLLVEDISIPNFSENEIPQFKPAQVWLLLAQLDTNKVTVPGDFPAKLSKLFAAYLAEPLTDIINTSIRRGEYPQLYKYEISTPVPKVYPPKTLSDVRNISGLLWKSY